MVQYEWTLETLEDGDIIESEFTNDEKLTFKKEYLTDNTDLGLVRNEGNDNEGLTDRLWAYVKDGKLPEFFCNERNEPTGFMIPARFHKELNRYFNSKTI
jgi:hypothetical protein